jgi:hypothetical protein
MIIPLTNTVADPYTTNFIVNIPVTGGLSASCTFDLELLSLPLDSDRDRERDHE